MNNIVYGYGSAIGGGNGTNITAAAYAGFVGGGSNNMIADGAYVTILGGAWNYAGSSFSTGASKFLPCSLFATPTL